MVIYWTFLPHGSGAKGYSEGNHKISEVIQVAGSELPSYRVSVRDEVKSHSNSLIKGIERAESLLIEKY